MHISLNQVFATEVNDDYTNWLSLTKGSHSTPLNLYKGMPYYRDVNSRTPAINFHSNPFKEDEEQTPWRDLIFQDEGRVIYNGDNKSTLKLAHETFGNKKVLKMLPLYTSKNKEDRMKAPPIIITKTMKIGNRTGFRKFIGFGLIHKPPKLIQQYEKDSDNVFSNYQYEVVLFKLNSNGKFHWKWIDDRRDSGYSDEDCMQNAPDSWKQWIQDGGKAIPNVMLKIKPYRILSDAEQIDMPQRNKQIISDLLTIHYPKPISDGVRFEAMASFITELFFYKYDYERGWITPGSSDRGVDFVGRLDIGENDFSKTSLIVLGQSKRYKNPISGERLTRVASRMTRGYIGVVVTLNTFTAKAQEEVKDDKLPIILINSKMVAELLLSYINNTNKSLFDIVSEQDEWAKSNLGTEHYETILNTF